MRLERFRLQICVKLYIGMHWGGGFAIGRVSIANLREDVHRHAFWGSFAIEWVLIADLRQAIHGYAFWGALWRFASRFTVSKKSICFHQDILHAPCDGMHFDTQCAFKASVCITIFYSPPFDGLGADSQIAFNLSVCVKMLYQPCDSLHQVPKSTFCLLVCIPIHC